MAKEIEPIENSTEKHSVKYRGVACLNCGHPLDMSYKYCPNCSQLNSIKKPSIKDYLEEFFSSMLSYDTKIFKTLTALLLRPGKITRDYIAGKRISYTNPFRFLLSLAIIYFLLMSFSGDYEQLNRYGLDSQEGFLDIDEDTFDTIDFGGNENEKNELIAQLDSLHIQELINERSRIKDSAIVANPNKELRKADELSFLPSHFKKQEIFSLLIKKDTIYSFEEAEKKYDLESTRSNKAAFNSARSVWKARKQPGEFVSDLFSKLPFTTFFFLPAFAFFIWLIYIRKKHTYTDHLIFSFHNQSLLFILLIISYLIDTIFKTNSVPLFITIFAFYLYKAMRNFYEQGRFKTIVKYSMLNTIFVILAGIGVVLLLTGSFLTY